MQPSDKDFDKLIRQAGDAYQPAGASPEWDKMQSLLDKHMPEKKDNRRRYLFIFLLLLLLGGGSYIYFRGAEKTSPVASATEAVITPNAPGGSPDKLTNPARETTGNGSSVQPVATVQPVPLSSQSGSDASTPVASNKRSVSRKGKANTIIESAAIDENSLPSQDEVAILSTNPGEKNTILPTEEKKIADPVQPTNPPTVELKTPTADSNTTTQQPVNSPMPPATVKTTKSTKQLASRHWEFTLLYAPELTTIGFSKLDKPGSNVGLLVGYPVSKHIILQTGIIRSRKNYTALGSDFKLDYTLPSGHSLTKVSGYCMMYELPLNIKSYLPTRKKLSVFYTAGISSYFMESEYYTYQIKTATGSYDKDVSYHTQRNYWFSLAALSVGLEQEISPHFNIAAAPFIKIPFKGMGEGSLKMTGTGISFSLVYKPVISKK